MFLVFPSKNLKGSQPYLHWRDNADWTVLIRMNYLPSDQSKVIIPTGACSRPKYNHNNQLNRKKNQIEINASNVEFTGQDHN